MMGRRTHRSSHERRERLQIASKMLERFCSGVATMVRTALSYPQALDAYLNEQRRGPQLAGDQIRNREVELSGAIAASEVIAEMGNRNNAASRVVGRISLFLENLVPNTLSWSAYKRKNGGSRLRWTT